MAELATQVAKESMKTGGLRHHMCLSHLLVLRHLG